MKYNEENIAEKLNEHLKRHFKGKNELVRISKEGTGVHWNCSLELEDRKSKINCFEFRNYEDIKPEYLISFEESGENKAWGRTYDIIETIKSSEEWINKGDRDILYQKFEFIDWYKRRIETIENQLLQFEPLLKQTKRELNSPWGSGLYDYSIEFKNRSCELNGFGEIEPTSFRMKWDDCNLFEVKQDDLEILSEILKKWLIDEIPPSILNSQYNWIEIGDLAQFYEQGEGIKGEFIKSWETVLKFYNGLSDESYPFVKDAIKLIHEMQSVGLDNKLRAGQSMFFFILSRSRRHGLEEENPFLHVTFLGANRMKVILIMNGEQKEIEHDVSYTGSFKEMVNELLNEKIK